MNARTLSCLAGTQALAQPTILTEPADQSVSLNATVQFKVGPLSSGGPVNFQWWFMDAALDPALNPSAASKPLNLSNVTETMAGAYWVVVSDDHGSATSSAAQLTVDPMFVIVTGGGLDKADADTWCPYWLELDSDGLPELVVAGGVEHRRRKAPPRL